MDQQELDAFMFNVYDATQEFLKELIDQVSADTGVSRRVLCVQAGKGLAMCGCAFIGNGLGQDDHDPSLAIANEVFRRFKTDLGSRN